MPSLQREMPLLLLRHAPELVPKLMQDSLHIAFPEHAELRAESEGLGDVAPAARQADLVLSARDAAGAPVASVVVEVQRRQDVSKRFAWPQYVASLHARNRCLTWLLVLTDDARVAAWARQTIPTFHPHPGFAPLVLGPADVPAISTEEDARASPELAILSVLFHQRDPEVELMARAALSAATLLDPPRCGLYVDLIFAALPQIAQRAMEALMQTGKYEYQSEFARKYFGEGRAEGRAEGLEEGLEQGREQGRDEARRALRMSIAAVLSARRLELAEHERQRLEAEHDLDVLEHWLSRATIVASTSELFEPSDPK